MSSDTTSELHLFDGPYILSAGRRVAIPEGSKRLVAFVALTRGRTERRRAAGILWPDGSDARAAGNLRSALWRLRTAGIDIIHSDKWSLELRAEVGVDADHAREWADRILGDRACADDLELRSWCIAALDLLPGWYEDWVLTERECSRQRMLHALEALSRTLLAAGHRAAATEAAMIVASREPLRESAQRVLIEAHLSEGNFVVAWRTFCRYRDRLVNDLGVGPSRDLTALLDAAAHATRDQPSTVLLPTAL